MFYGAGNGHLPIVFKLYDQKKISANTLIAFNEIFGISNFKTRGFHGLTIVDADRMKRYQKIFDKYSPIVYNYFKDIKWKQEIQAYHHEIMKRK
jgi:5-formaminoimidazole-4-carboxamide-1-beta-D-ribofuranosyl 5'-monophosphate synthetase